MKNLNTFPPEQADLLIRKKRFWKRTMWISLGFSVFAPIAGYTFYKFGTNRIFGSLRTGDIDITQAAIELINMQYSIFYITLPLTALGLLIFLTSIIRCLSLPKLSE